MNEALRVDYLQQMGVVSWMPRMPLPGALPSTYYQPEPATEALPAEPLSVDTLPSDSVPSPNSSVASEVRGQSAISGRVESEMAQVPSDTGGDNTAVQVPDKLRLGLIQTHLQGPLIICNITDQSWPDHQVLPMVNQIMGYLRQPLPSIGMAFDWPFPGTTAEATPEEFLKVLKALLSGARLQCPPGQACWWFGELPELLAESELLEISLHYPDSLTALLTQPGKKVHLLRYLLHWQSQQSPS
ncbi:hypothetical protein [Oceanospirillum sediminis]|uniref:Uncharacterized protein n=1 Tax=Oceanospirillum sediminis TaxID=2760088 RepID=A0A839IXJ0_9GAMM|nr:hypothetical protein [Oceanospirillum sediminis]MBB1488806.1 hypothetical protein [Oceanospirillum sediminis]